MKIFKRYKPYDCFIIDEKAYILIQIGVASWVLVDEEGKLLNNGMNGKKVNYITHKELTTLADTDKVKLEGYVIYSPIINEIQNKIFKMLRNDD